MVCLAHKKSDTLNENPLYPPIPIIRRACYWS